MILSENIIYLLFECIHVIKYLSYPGPSSCPPRNGSFRSVRIKERYRTPPQGCKVQRLPPTVQKNHNERT